MYLPNFAAAAVLGSLLLASPASATPSPTGPPPGATVSSRPTFAIADTTSDIVLLTVAMSRYPDVKTAGDDTGAFVSIDAFETWSIPDDLVDGLARWPANERLEAGTWYWHAHLNSGFGYPWTPVVRAVVRDEAPLVTGWRLKVRRVKASKRCARRVIIIGKATYEDNSPAAERKTWVLKLKSRAVTVARVTGSDNYGTISLEGVTCTRRLGRLTATLAIVDAAKHVALAPPKAIEL